ncbi:hypothetical protein ISN41_22135 [Enterobacter bugandensis]|uniref:glycosyltransferase family 9 protein n=1 Tax=Enterobacter bugandensis TaxID=881260 RepID=UPI001888BC34|nr:hypothetical protein [Enterobacter bugandensis]MBF2750779.1 hypothetical protein [Enterobacter bugandensis]MBF2803621.1 hypothetical protein [Enterobacter bugandensis]
MQSINKKLNTYQGSLLADNTNIIASYDVEQGEKYTSLKMLREDIIANKALNKIKFKISNSKHVNIINGFGVTLGDSIIGLNVCLFIKEMNEKIKINIARPCTTPESLESLYYYALQAGIFDSVTRMPFPLSECNQYDFNIDMGNQLYRNDFQSLEMHDYFFEHMGISPHIVPHAYKKNHWLKRLPNEIKNKGEYILFCPNASTQIRAIPYKYHTQVIESIAKKYNLPVLGFSPAKAELYTDISLQVTNTLSYINVIRNSNFVYTADSSAVHIAAGFDIPCHCIFTSIDPDLRIRYYPNCISSFIGDAVTQGLHFTESREIIHHVQKLYENYFKFNSH